MFCLMQAGLRKFLAANLESWTVDYFSAAKFSKREDAVKQRQKILDKEGVNLLVVEEIQK